MQQEYYDIETDEPSDDPINGADMTELEKQSAELAQLAILLQEGVTFKTPKRSILRLFGAKERTWSLQQPYLGTLDYLSKEMLGLDFSEEALISQGLPEAHRLREHNTRRFARIVAIALLNSKWGIRLFADILSEYLFWRVKPDQLYKLTILINQQSNLPDFINSIRLMSIAPRRTAPIETKTGAGQPD